MAITNKYNYVYEDNPEYSDVYVNAYLNALAGYGYDQAALDKIAESTFGVAKPAAVTQPATVATVAPPPVTTQTFSDQITAGTPTTEEELLSVISTPASTTGNTTAVGGTTQLSANPTAAELQALYLQNGVSTPVTYTTEQGDQTVYNPIEYEGGVSLWENPGEILGYEGQGENAIPIYADATLGGYSKKDGDFINFYDLNGNLVARDKWNKGAWEAAWDDFGPIISAVATGYLGGIPLGDTGLTAANALNAVRAADSGNVLGVLSNTVGALPSSSFNVAGYTGKDALNAAKFVTALDDGNVAGILSTAGSLTDSSDLRVAGAAAQVLAAADSGNYNSIFNAAVGLDRALTTPGSTGSTASTGSTTVGDFEDNEVTRLQGLGYTNQQIQDYFDTLDNLTGVFDDQSAVLTDTTTGGTADTANLVASGLDQDTADFLTSIGITSIDQLADSGLSNQDILDMVGAGDDELIVTDAKGTDTITGTNTTTGGGTDDVEELVVTDKKGTDTVTGIDTITGGDGNDLVVDDKGEVVIKDKKESCPIGTVLNPETGECDPVEEKLTCPPGKVPNDAGTACIDEVVIKDKKESCPVGTALNPETGECEPIAKTLDCPEGYEPNEAGTACIPVVTITDKKCDPGFEYDEDLKQCVAIKTTECAPGFHDDGTGLCVPDDDKKPLDCPEGYEPNEAGTACIPVVVIQDKKCDPGYVYDEDLKQCVPIKGDEPCAEGYHRDEATGLCVPDDDDKCEAGYEKFNGACVPVCADGYVRNLATGVCEKAEEPCPEGYERDEVTGACIPVVVIKDKKCDPGYVYDEDLKQCVPIEDEPCAEGFHLENGLCVPDGEECEDGYEKVNGACVPVCKEGYVRNLATGVCEKVTEDKPCPPGQVKNAEGKCVPIVTPPPPPPPPPVIKTPPTIFAPSTSAAASGEKTEPIYAEGMDAFDLFATLQELLAEEPKKKDSKKSKEKTKMATGGHLDDLLAEQMTVDDLLKLLR